MKALIKANQQYSLVDNSGSMVYLNDLDSINIFIHLENIKSQKDSVKTIYLPLLDQGEVIQVDLETMKVVGYNDESEMKRLVQNKITSNYERKR